MIQTMITKHEIRCYNKTSRCSLFYNHVIPCCYSGQVIYPSNIPMNKVSFDICFRQAKLLGHIRPVLYRCTFLKTFIQLQGLRLVCFYKVLDVAMKFKEHENHNFTLVSYIPACYFWLHNTSHCFITIGLCMYRLYRELAFLLNVHCFL